MRFVTIIACELAKLRRVSLVWISATIMVAIAVVLNLFMWIAAHPEMAAGMGLLGQKATLSFGGESPGWPLLAYTLKEISGLGGLLWASFILAWLFGREYLLDTAKIMLVLPVPRWWHALAKSLLGLAWLAALMVLLWVAAGVAGLVQGLGGAGPGALLAEAPKLVVLILAAWATALPVAWVAVATRGVFAPLGYAIGTLLVASTFLNLGWGVYVPWSVLGILSGAGGAGIELNAGSLVSVLATACLGLGLAGRHLSRADHAAA